MLSMLVLLAEVAQARPVAGESSTYGSFSVKKDADACVLMLKSPNRGDVSLAPIACDATAEEKVDTLLLPARSADGVEFHIFTNDMPSEDDGMMGNAIDVDAISTYMIVVLSSDRVWISEASTYIYPFQGAVVVSGAQGATLRLDERVTLREGAQRYEIWMGGKSERALPPSARIVTSTRSEVYVGVMESPIHATDWLDYISTKSEEMMPVHAGTCKLESYYGANVSMNVRVETLSSGQEEAICVAVQKVSAAAKP